MSSIDAKGDLMFSSLKAGDVVVGTKGAWIIDKVIRCPKTKESQVRFRNLAWDGKVFLIRGRERFNEIVGCHSI